MEENEAGIQKETEQASKAPSEMSEPGAASEPKPQWSRLGLFNKVMQKSLDKLIDEASFNTFAKAFGPFHKEDPQKTEKIHKVFIGGLRRTIQEELSSLTEEGQLESKLNELDKLESAAKNNPDPAWRPSGIPEQDFASHLKPYYKKQKAYMRLELKKIQAENASLAQKVQAGRERIAQTEHCIAVTVDEWQASVTEFERMMTSLSPSGVNDSGFFDV